MNIMYFSNTVYCTNEQNVNQNKIKQKPTIIIYKYTIKNIKQKTYKNTYT